MRTTKTDVMRLLANVQSHGCPVTLESIQSGMPGYRYGIKFGTASTQYYTTAEAFEVLYAAREITTDNV